MFYAWDITVSADTEEASPKTQDLKLTAGVITRVDIKFPPGCHGLVKIRILHSEFQLIPLRPSSWVTGDGETIPTETFYTIPADRNVLKFQGISPGSTYDHTITVRVSLQPEEVASYWPLIKLFKTFFERIGVI